MLGSTFEEDKDTLKVVDLADQIWGTVLAATREEFVRRHCFSPPDDLCQLFFNHCVFANRIAGQLFSDRLGVSPRWMKIFFGRDRQPLSIDSCGRLSQVNQHVLCYFEYAGTWNGVDFAASQFLPREAGPIQLFKAATEIQLGEVIRHDYANYNINLIEEVGARGFRTNHAIWRHGEK